MATDLRRNAVLKGALEAEKLHSSLGIDTTMLTSCSYIDVFRTIDSLGIPLLFRPLKGLWGAYIPSPTPGIIVNSERPRHLQRITAAHELGHYILRHEPSLDRNILGRMPGISSEDHPEYSLPEIEAEAFASAFLLPRWLLVHHLEKKQKTPAELRDPETVYQLSLRVGASYKATIWALHHHGMLRRLEARKLDGVSPKEIKQSIDRYKLLENPWADVWLLDEKDNGSVIDANPDDLFYSDCVELVTSGYSLSTTAIQNAQVIIDERSPSPNMRSIGSNATRHLVISHLGREGKIVTFQNKQFDASAAPKEVLDIDFIGVGSERGLPKIIVRN